MTCCCDYSLEFNYANQFTCCGNRIPQELCVVLKNWLGLNCRHNLTGSMSFNSALNRWEGQIDAAPGCAAYESPRILVMKCEQVSESARLRLYVDGGPAIDKTFLKCNPFEVSFCPAAGGDVRIFESTDDRCEPVGLYPIGPCNQGCPGVSMPTTPAQPMIEVSALTATITSGVCACLNGVTVTLAPDTGNTWYGTFTACGHNWEMIVTLSFSSGSAFIRDLDNPLCGSGHSITAGQCTPAFSMTFSGSGLLHSCCSPDTGSGNIPITIVVTE